MVMGTNIGTSITSTIVAMTQIKDEERFGKAFACAVIHDFFNWLTVFIMFVLEVTTGLLFVSECQCYQVSKNFKSTVCLFYL